MLESIFAGESESVFAVGDALLCLLTSVVLGILVSLTYAKTNRNGPSKNFLLTLIMLPAVICVIIMLVGSNVARAFSLAGAFSLVRFRSEPGDPKDIAYVCLVMAVGLSTGMGYLTYALMFSAILCALLFVFATVTARSSKEVRYLHITVPEDLNYSGAFDDVLARYTTCHTLSRVRTSDLGSLFRLDYTVVLKDSAQEKELIDALRCRNGNLDIALLLAPSPN